MKFKIIVITIVIIILLILVPSIIKVMNDHNENLYNVVESRITEAAVLCIKEENCEDDIVYLNELYEFSYLEAEYDPVTKKYYEEDSYVLINENKAEFISVE